MSRWDYKGMVVQEHALMEALLSMEGKVPLKANKLLKAPAAWKESTHLLSTFRFQALTTHINSFNVHNNPHEMCPITTHSSTLRIMEHRPCTKVPTGFWREPGIII